MNIKELKIEELKAYENNPRNNDGAVAAVAESIKQFGFKVPIIIDKDNVIVCGHTRLKAAKRLKLETVPCIVADDLTPEQIQAFRLADNKTAELAEWDMSKLNEEIQALQGLEIDMSCFGFDMTEFDTAEPQEITEDEVPEVAEGEPVSQLGDIWQLGEHRLICGDSTDALNINILMNGRKADLVFTDPPYGYEYESNHQDKYKMLKNDDKILDYVSSVYDVLKDDCSIYSFCGWQSIKKWLDYFDNTKLKLKNVIVWKKNNWSMGDLKCAYAGQYEIILYLNKGKKELNGKRDTDIWEFDREPPTMHPTMKPVELIAFALNKSSNKKDIVLDVFGGSGSTLIACEQLNRVCYMCELDPKYCDVIVKRWETLTGKKAERL